MGVCVGRTCLQPALDAHKFVFGVFYDRHCTDSCSDGSDFVFGLSNLGRSKRPYELVQWRTEQKARWDDTVRGCSAELFV